MMQTLEAHPLARLLDSQPRRSRTVAGSAPAAARAKRKPAVSRPAAVFTLEAAESAKATVLQQALCRRVPSFSPADISGVDKDALFRGLVSEYGASLYYFVLKRVGHADDAADIAQQAFVEAACSLSRYRGEAEISTWIFGIATNLARNHINRAPQNRHRFESDEVLEDSESPTLQPCESMSQRQGLSLVTEAMRALPPEMAQALSLVAIDELSYEEAAAELDVPVGTVRSRVSRARAAVRKHLRAAGYLGAEAA